MPLAVAVPVSRAGLDTPYAAGQARQRQFQHHGKHGCPEPGHEVEITIGSPDSSNATDTHLSVLTSRRFAS